MELDLPGLTSYLSAALYTNDKYEHSKVVYVDIVSLPADSKDTVLCVLNNLHESFIKQLGFRWLIVVGDAKTYDILQSLRRQYGSQMQWLLPFPGEIITRRCYLRCMARLGCYNWQKWQDTEEKH